MQHCISIDGLAPKLAFRVWSRDFPDPTIPVQEPVIQLPQTLKVGPHCCRACFETRPLGAPQHEEALDRIKKNSSSPACAGAGSEQAAKRPCRRTQSVDPAARNLITASQAGIHISNGHPPEFFLGPALGRTRGPVWQLSAQ
jgi:hypothetical protein